MVHKGLVGVYGTDQGGDGGTVQKPRDARVEPVIYDRSDAPRQGAFPLPGNGGIHDQYVPFQRPKHLRDGNLIRGANEAEAPGGSLLGIDKAGATEQYRDLFEIPRGNALAFPDRGQGHRFPDPPFRQVNEEPNAVSPAG